MDYFISRNKLDDDTAVLWSGKPTCHDGQYSSDGYIAKSIAFYAAGYFMTLPLGGCKMLTNNEYNTISMISRKSNATT